MSTSSKPRASDDEILFLITIRRQAALESMRQIVEGFGMPPHVVPSIGLLNNYFMNRVFCIELMLKLLSGNWRSHDVGAMYQAVFSKPHPSPQLMLDIKSAIMDQKYLFEPASGLDGSVPDLEALQDEIQAKLKKAFPNFSIDSTVSLPKSFTEYVRDHAERFCRVTSPSYGPNNPPPADLLQRLTTESHSQLQQVRKTFRDHADKHNTFDCKMHISSLTQPSK